MPWESHLYWLPGRFIHYLAYDAFDLQALLQSEFVPPFRKFKHAGCSLALYGSRCVPG